MGKGLFYIIESEGEFANGICAQADWESFLNVPISELAGALRSLGRRADFEFAEQAYAELEQEKKNARQLLRSVDTSHQRMLGRHLEETTARLEKIGREIILVKDAEKIKEKEREKYALNITNANLATAHLKASEELAFLKELEKSIDQSFVELEKILGQLSPLIKQAYLPPPPNNLEKTLKKQKALLEKIREPEENTARLERKGSPNQNNARLEKAREKNKRLFYGHLQEILMELIATNEKVLPFLDRMAEALELLERALGEWASLHALLLKYSRDMDTMNKGMAQVLEGAGFNSIPQLERRMPAIEPAHLPIPPKQALFLKNRILEVNVALSSAQWRVYAKAHNAEPPPTQKSSPKGPESSTPPAAQ